MRIKTQKWITIEPNHSITENLLFNYHIGGCIKACEQYYIINHFWNYDF